MKISVVIPIFNAENTLEQCLRSIAEQSLKPTEIILIDNNSTDNSYSIAENFKKENNTFKITITKEAKTGPSAARNKGISLAQGDIIAFTDSDCIAHAGWLKKLLQEYKDDSIVAVAGNIKGFKPKGFVEKFLSLFTLRGLPEKTSFNSFNLISGGFATANLSVKRNVLKEINGFNEDMKIYTEDFDLCARIYRLGHGITYTPDALVYHIHRKSIKGLIKQSFGFGRGHGFLLKKLFKRMFIIELPKFTLLHERIPIKLWINLVTADKKILFLIILGIFYWPLFTLLIIYLFYLLLDIDKRCRKEKIPANFTEKLIMVFLLLIKSLSLTCGRIYSSFRYGTICI